MKNFALIFLIVFIFVNCEKSEITQLSENKSQTKPRTLPTQEAGTGQSGRDQGNPKFRTTDIKYYVGCWQPEKNFKPRLENKSDVFHITEESIQTSKMSKPIRYEEINTNDDKEYFVLYLKSKDESKQLKPYIYIFMPLDKEMTLSTLEDLATENNIDDKAENHWNLTTTNCKQVFEQLKKN